MENESARKAQQLLRFYFRRLFAAAKAEWDADAAGDIENIIPLILEALDEQIGLGIAKALLTTQMANGPERVTFCGRNLRLADIEGMTRTAAGGYRLHFSSGRVLDLTPQEGAPLWELLQAQAIDLENGQV